VRDASWLPAKLTVAAQVSTGLGATLRLIVYVLPTRPLSDVTVKEYTVVDCMAPREMMGLSALGVMVAPAGSVKASAAVPYESVYGRVMIPCAAVADESSVMGAMPAAVSSTLHVLSGLRGTTKLMVKGGALAPDCANTVKV
jgi:hypothetical protein